MNLKRIEKEFDTFGRQSVLQETGIILQEDDQQIAVRFLIAIQRIEQELHSVAQFVGLRLQDELFSFEFALVQLVDASRTARILGQFEKHDE